MDNPVLKNEIGWFSTYLFFGNLFANISFIVIVNIINLVKKIKLKRKQKALQKLRA
jgi:hypothetical protein